MILYSALFGSDMSAVRAHRYFEGVDFKNLKQLVSCRGPYPPIRDSCFSHMARNWDHWKNKWIQYEWLSPCEGFPEAPPERGMYEANKALVEKIGLA